MSGSNDMCAGGNDLLYLPIPSTGILAVCPYKFFYGKMFVCVVPVDPRVRMKIAADGIGILLQDDRPVLFYILLFIQLYFLLNFLESSDLSLPFGLRTALFCEIKTK